MAGGFPALPKGFEPVDESGGFPALPKGFAPAENQPFDRFSPLKVKVKDDATYNQVLVTALKNGADADQVTKFAAVNGRQPPNNLKEVLAYRDKYGTVSDKVITEIPDDSQRSGLRNFAEGALRAPESMVEGLAQLLIRGGSALGLIDEPDAKRGQEVLGTRSQENEAIKVRGKAGPVGKFAGEVATTYAVPFGKVSKFGKAGNVAATAAKRAAAGGVVAEISGAEKTAAEQDKKGLIGAVTAPLAIPVAEKVFGAIGSKLGNAYLSIAGNGVGKKIYDQSGNLTTYGNVLRARLKTVGRGLPDEMIDDTLKQIAIVNPKRLPTDEAIIPEMLASKEKVPLTTGMKVRDNRAIQDFESLQAGSVGTKAGQEAAIARSKDIDTAITGNVKDIGSGATSADASSNIARDIAKGYDDGKAAVDKLYEPLNRIRIKAPKQVAAIATNARQAFGKGGYTTLGSTARSYIDRINTIADDGKPLFGDVWKLSKDINEDLRAATGSDKYQLGVIKKSVDEYFTQAAKAGSGVTELAAAQLKQANAAYRQFSRAFGENPVKLNAGRTVIPDQAGKSVGKIIGMAKAASDRGEPLQTELIENAIFGQAKALDSSGAKQAAVNIQRLIKAAPSTRQAVKDITVNRIVAQMEEGFLDKTLKPEKVQTIIRAAVDNNKPLLKAAGFSDIDITRLQTNAYLASLKVPAVGARQRGSSSTNRGAARAVASKAFRGALAAALTAGGYKLGGPFAALLLPLAGDRAAMIAGDVASKRLANKALSSKVPLEASKGGRNAGEAIARRIGAATLANQE